MPAESPRDSLTRVDTSDNVSFLGMGAVWDPRLFSLFEVEDQIRLGNWVSYPGEGKMVAVPMESRLSLSTPKSFALYPPRTISPHNLCSERS